MGKVIGQALGFGFPGNVSRTSDTVIAPYPVFGSEHILYGAPVAFDPDSGGVSAVSASTPTANIIGFAVRRIGQPYADSEDGWYYKEGDTCDVLMRGSISVSVENATDIAARGAVYVDVVTLGITSVKGSNLAIPNAIFSTGKVDASNVAEVTILARSM